MTNKFIKRRDELTADFMDTSPVLTTLLLGAAAGSQRLYANIDVLKPGAKSAKMHSHSLQEEFFLVLKGDGTLRVNDQEYAVRTGDCFAKPAGQQIAHQFINTSNDLLEILDVGIPDPNDEIFYPDDDVLYSKSKKKAFKNGHDISELWTSDPNQS